MKKNFILAAAVLMVFLLSSCVYYVDRPDVYTNQAPPESYFYSYSPGNAMAYSYQAGATPVNFLILKVYDNRYVFYDNNNTEIANWIFQPNGTVIKRGRVIDGLVTVFYGPGRPAAEIMYKNNERDGFSRFYYANGKPMELGDYSKGVKSGDWKKFNEEGALNEEFAFNNGKINYKLKPKNPANKGINQDFDYLEREYKFKKEVKQDFNKKDVYPENYTRVFGGNPYENSGGNSNNKWNQNNRNNGYGNSQNQGYGKEDDQSGNAYKRENAEKNRNRGNNEQRNGNEIAEPTPIPQDARGYNSPGRPGLEKNNGRDNAMHNGVKPQDNAMNNGVKTQDNAMNNGVKTQDNAMNNGVKPQDNAMNNSVKPQDNAINNNAKSQDNAMNNGVKPQDAMNKGFKRQDNTINSGFNPQVNGSDRQSSGRGTDNDVNTLKTQPQPAIILTIAPTVEQATVPTVVPTAIPAVVPTVAIEGKENLRDKKFVNENRQDKNNRDSDAGVKQAVQMQRLKQPECLRQRYRLPQQLRLL